MRELPVSTEENDFMLGALTKKVRLDKREMLNYRELSINFGWDLGYCMVSLGDTKVMAQVTAEVDRPRESRPSEGRLTVHLEMSTLAAGFLDPTKPGTANVEIQQFLEKSLTKCDAVDVEELCLRSGEKCWNVHLHLNLINHDGNVLDCASIAAICALKHFKRPSVQFCGTEVKVQSIEESNPVPLTVNHMPLCCTFSFFNEGNQMVLDANYKEEKVRDGKLMVSMNRHRQICKLLMYGSIQINKQQVLKCNSIAATKVKDITEFIQKALKIDSERRSKKKFDFTPITAHFGRNEEDEQKEFGYQQNKSDSSEDCIEADIENEAMETEDHPNNKKKKSEQVNGRVEASWFEEPAGKNKKIEKDSDEDVVVLGD